MFIVWQVAIQMKAFDREQIWNEEEFLEKTIEM